MLGSDPPACAKSGLPPPPLPPTVSDPIFTNFTASYFLVSLSVTPTASPILSSLIAKIITIPSVISFFPLSTNFLKSLEGRSVIFCNLT